MIPGLGSQMQGMDIDEGELHRFEAIIHSMTPGERKNPDIIEASRRRRIARGSGTDPKDVSGLIKSFSQVRDMMRAMSGMSMMDRMRSATQFAKMAAGGFMPRIKLGGTVKKRRETRADKRKRRKKNR
jgi:signal recognition particle subunit SRP54